MAMKRKIAAMFLSGMLVLQSAIGVSAEEFFVTETIPVETDVVTSEQEGLDWEQLDNVESQTTMDAETQVMENLGTVQTDGAIESGDSDAQNPSNNDEIIIGEERTGEQESLPKESLDVQKQTEMQMVDFLSTNDTYLYEGEGIRAIATLSNKSSLLEGSVLKVEKIQYDETKMWQYQRNMELLKYQYPDFLFGESVIYEAYFATSGGSRVEPESIDGNIELEFIFDEPLFVGTNFDEWALAVFQLKEIYNEAMQEPAVKSEQEQKEVMQAVEIPTKLEFTEEMGGLCKVALKAEILTKFVFTLVTQKQEMELETAADVEETEFATEETNLV